MQNNVDLMSGNRLIVGVILSRTDCVLVLVSTNPADRRSIGFWSIAEI